MLYKLKITHRKKELSTAVRTLKVFTMYLFISVFFVSCVIQQSASKKEGTVTTWPFNKNSIVMTFAGDLMAHTVNFSMKDYRLIYDDVKPLLQNDDLSFVNIETPVCDALPMSTYPRFNVHSSYLRAAAEAGFDVFSFANNHTNDQNVTGIDGTIASISMIKEERKENKIPLAYSGLKTTENEPVQISRINYHGWTILFCSVTELLNSYDASKKRLYYSSPRSSSRTALLDFIMNARKNNECDIFVLSLHLNEAEYVRTVSAAKKKWFKELAEAGVDIIWAHHPHVMQSWETITVQRIVESNYDESRSTKTVNAFCMYSMGNFISGQRWETHYDDPSFFREYTGDAALLQLRVSRSDTKGLSFSVNPVLITQYNELPNPVVKRFTNEWIQTLNKKEKKYFLQRLALMKAYLPL